MNSLIRLVYIFFKVFFFLVSPQYTPPIIVSWLHAQLNILNLTLQCLKEWNVQQGYYADLKNIVEIHKNVKPLKLIDSYMQKSNKLT